jgi:hypothetical protein
LALINQIEIVDTLANGRLELVCIDQAGEFDTIALKLFRDP